jgi:hypothetical protein
MVKQARISGIHFNWVGVDGGYGKEPDFLRNLVSPSNLRVTGTILIRKATLQVDW